jgi:S-sulfosulfanyl-L-cysteine sulfohydrolase
MASLIETERAPFKAQLEEVIGTTESLLFRRGNFRAPGTT